MDEDEEVFTELMSKEFVSMPMLSVNVDFNDLLEDKGLDSALDIIAQLKDLLR